MPNLSARPYSDSFSNFNTNKIVPSLDQYKASILNNMWSLHGVVHLDDSASVKTLQYQEC